MAFWWKGRGKKKTPKPFYFRKRLEHIPSVTQELGKMVLPGEGQKQKPSEGRAGNILEVQDPEPRQNRDLYHGERDRTTPPAQGPPQIHGRVLGLPGEGQKGL